MADTRSEVGFESVSQKMNDISKSFDTGQSNISNKTTEENIQAFARYQDWLQNLQQMQSGIIKACTDEQVTSTEAERREDISSRIAVLQEELVAESMRHGIKELIVHNAQLASRLHELLFPQQQPSEEELERTDWARALCDKQRTLTSDTLAHHQACQSLQDKIDERKKEIRDIQASNIELMKRLQSLEVKEQKGSGPSRALQQQQQKLESLTSHITMERGILQGLIIGSGVNWAKDPALREMVIGIGKPLVLD